MKKMVLVFGFFIVCLPVYANTVVDKLLQQYQQQGAVSPVPDRGKKLWYSKSADRSCTSCHGNSPADTGKHAKTRKVIRPMTASANPERYQNSKKIEKWFLRNCKWTWGRSCTVQEKADILSWLNQN